MKRRNRAQRLLRLTAVYLLLLPFLLLGWLYSRLPDRVYLEPGQALLLPRFGWVEPMGLHGSQNAASTQVVGSYQTTLSLGGWLPIKNIRTVVTERAGHGLRYAVRGQNVLRGGTDRWLFRYRQPRREHSEPGKGSGTAPGRPRDPHWTDQDGKQ